MNLLALEDALEAIRPRLAAMATWLDRVIVDVNATLEAIDVAVQVDRQAEPATPARERAPAMHEAIDGVPRRPTRSGARKHKVKRPARPPAISSVFEARPRFDGVDALPINAKRFAAKD